MNRYKSKVQALARLAEDQRGKPEGELARQKLLQIINKYPTVAEYQPVIELVEKDLMMADIAWMRRHGVDLDGKWTGRNLFEAIMVMEADYKQRLARAKRGRLAAPSIALPVMR